MKPSLWKKRLLRVALVLLALILLILVTYRLWAPRIAALAVLYVTREQHLDITPVPHELSTSVLPGTTYSFDSILITLPWKVSELTVGSTSPSFLSLRFKDETHAGSILVMHEIPLKEQNLEERTKLAYVWGSDTTSEYEKIESVAMASPKNIHMLHSTESILSESVRLMFKSILFPSSASTTAYSFTTTNEMRGIEFSSGSSTMAYIFTPKDMGYEVIISRATPVEVESILQSIRLK